MNAKRTKHWLRLIHMQAAAVLLAWPGARAMQAAAR